MNSESIAAMLGNLTTDSWREGVGFSSDIAEANQILFRAKGKDAAEVLGKWLQRFQPCLFGRIAAKKELLTYCILREEDLMSGDEVLRARIQEARTKWTRAGFEGRSSGFVILLISPIIASAVPDDRMKALAQRLCSLYLLDEIETDRIYLDEVFLEIPGVQKRTWRWQSGVNYFCSQGDKRWWQDHRIPGGIGFSTNSVGHMVKSNRLMLRIDEIDSLVQVEPQGERGHKVDSLPSALEFAMRTISIASDGPSGKATTLLPLPADRSELAIAECPIKLPRFLEDKNFCEYKGFYHTDYTLPSEYFSPDIMRPERIREHGLDFTYLFADQVSNPAFTTMGTGRQVRRGDPKSTAGVPARRSRFGRFVPEELLISNSNRLAEALRT